jgi:2-isopropylmalate synthase
MHILDTTLREGELFKFLGFEQKLEVLELLANAGLKRIELTLPYPPRTSKEHARSFILKSRDLGVLCVLHARAYKEDVANALSLDADGYAFYIGFSELHRKQKLHGITKEDALNKLLECLEMVKTAGYTYTRATLEDASRVYLEEGIEGYRSLVYAIKKLHLSGYTLISVPDTAGLLTPRLASSFFQSLKRDTNAPLAAHFHNDYGYASANTVEAALVGVEELHTTVMGIGDRNGIADLYEVVSALEDVHNIPTCVKREELKSLYDRFCKITGIPLPWRHPLSNEARSIRAGVHQALSVKNAEGYIPKKKLLFDFASPLFVISPYVGSNLITWLLNGQPAKELSFVLSEIATQEGVVDKESLFRILQKHGYKVSLEKLSLISDKKALVFLKLKQAQLYQNIIKDALTYDFVERVNFVKGDAELLITLKSGSHARGFVWDLRKKFGAQILDARVLYVDGGV